MMKAAKPLSCHSFSKASDLLWRSILDHLVRPAKGIEGDLVGCNTVEGSDLVRVAPLGYHVAGFGYYCVIDTDLLCSSISSMYVVYCRLHHTNRFNHVISISSLIVRPISLASYIIRESIPLPQSGIFGRRSTSLIRIVCGLNANAISLSIWFQPYRYLNHCLHRSIEGPADSVTRDPVWIGVTMDVSSTRAYLMLDHIWIFISGYVEQYVRCPSFNWSLPLGLDRRILYGSHRTLSIMAIMAPDNGVFRFSTLRTGMCSFAYGMEFLSVIINHEKMAAMTFRHEPCVDHLIRVSFWYCIYGCNLAEVGWCIPFLLSFVSRNNLYPNLSPDTSNGTVIGGYCCHSPNVSFITI